MKRFFILLTSFASLCLAQWPGRTVGPEPGLEFSSPPYGASICQWGEHQRFPNATYVAGCGDNSKFINFVNEWPTHQRGNDSSFTLFPWLTAQKYFIKATYNGAPYDLIENPGTKTDPNTWVHVLNITDPNFQSFVFLNWIPNTIIPTLVNKQGHAVTTTNPLWLSQDGDITNYTVGGVRLSSGRWTNKGITWASGLPQNQAQWNTANHNWYQYAAQHQPLVRMSPHTGFLNAPSGAIDWSAFQYIFQYCPGIEIEEYPITQLVTGSVGYMQQIYNQIQNIYWFGNVAPKVFTNDPATRVVQWGVKLNNGFNQIDLHTAFAAYALIRGKNSFFEPLLPGEIAVNPSTWLSTANALGVGTTAPQVVSGAAPLVLFKRQFANGRAYLNLTKATQTIYLSGAKNWSGQPVSQLVLAPGHGDVVLGVF
jgi:hypothetical protein